MKITISAYEGSPEFCSFTAEMPDETNLSDFCDNLEAIMRCFYPGVQLDVRMPAPVIAGKGE